MKLNCSNVVAFTLIELLVVIAIIGILAAMVGPSIGSFRKGDAMAAATSQLLGGVSRGRQLAIANHTDVYMVFLPTNYWANVNSMSPQEQRAVTNLVDKQLAGYAFVSFRTVGDQPGQPQFRYLSSWQSLPDGIYIPPEKFTNVSFRLSNFDSIDKPEFGTNVWSFDRINNVPFPLETSTNVLALPCIAFDYQGRLISGNNFGENIPLAQGSIVYGRNPQTKQLQLTDIDVLERPAGNSVSGYNIVHVDRLTGRGHLERREVR